MAVERHTVLHDDVLEIEPRLHPHIVAGIGRVEAILNLVEGLHPGSAVVNDVVDQAGVVVDVPDGGRRSPRVGH